MTKTDDIEALLTRIEAIGDDARRIRLAYYTAQGAKPLHERAGVVLTGWDTWTRAEAVYQALLIALQPDKPSVDLGEIEQVLLANGRREPRGEISTTLSYLKDQGRVERPAYRRYALPRA